MVRKAKDNRGTDVYSDEVIVRPRMRERKGDEGHVEDAIATMVNGQPIEISAFNYGKEVRVQEECDGSVYSLAQRGFVSAVAAKFTGFATGGRHAPSRGRLVELIEQMGSDKIVAFHLPVGVTTKRHRQLAYSGVGMVQLATSAGLRRALGKEVCMAGKVIVLDPIGKEFVVERLVGVLQSFRGPRCVLNGNEEERISEWKSPLNFWRSDPYEWSFELEKMLEEACVSERHVRTESRASSKKRKIEKTAERDGEGERPNTESESGDGNGAESSGTPWRSRSWKTGGERERESEILRQRMARLSLWQASLG